MDSLLLTKQEVAHLTHRSTSSIQRDERAGLFPARVAMPNGSVYWHRAEIEAWIAALPRASESAPRRTVRQQTAAPVALAAKANNG